MIRDIKPEYEIGYECACPVCHEEKRNGFCKYEKIVRMLNEKESITEYLFVCQHPACKSVYKAGNNVPEGTMK